MWHKEKRFRTLLGTWHPRTYLRAYSRLQFNVCHRMEPSIFHYKAQPSKCNVLRTRITRERPGHRQPRDMVSLELSVLIYMAPISILLLLPQTPSSNLLKSVRISHPSPLLFPSLSSITSFCPTNHLPSSCQTKWPSHPYRSSAPRSSRAVWLLPVCFLSTLRMLSV